MATETTAASPVPIELELQPSSQNAVEQENTLANQPQPASARTSTGPLRLIPRRRLQSGVWETASNVASFIPRGFKSLFRSFVNVLKSMNKMVLLGGLFIATAGCVPAYMGLSLQAWTARKDYLQECRDHFVSEPRRYVQGATFRSLLTMTDSRRKSPTFCKASAPKSFELGLVPLPSSFSTLGATTRR